MWYGKISIILYVFSLAILFSTYFFNQIFNDPALSASVSEKGLEGLMKTTYSFNQTVNTSFLFGDFYNTYLVLEGLFTGGIFQQVFSEGGVLDQSGLTVANIYLQILMGLLFDSATVFFILYIISNRSI